MKNVFYSPARRLRPYCDTVNFWVIEIGWGCGAVNAMTWSSCFHRRLPLFGSPIRPNMFNVVPRMRHSCFRPYCGTASLKHLPISLGDPFSSQGRRRKLRARIHAGGNLKDAQPQFIVPKRMHLPYLTVLWTLMRLGLYQYALDIEG